MNELDNAYQNRYAHRGVIVTEGESSSCSCPGCQTVLVASHNNIVFALMASGWEYFEYAGYVCRSCAEKDQLE